MNGGPTRVLVVGAGGQLGRSLVETAPTGVSVTGLARADLDITDRKAVDHAIAELRPRFVVNAAAYTAVDRAEQERTLAFKVNRDGAAHLARAARNGGARFIHVSTDYVFDGTVTRPYRPDDTPNPINTYGESKLAGERAVLDETRGEAIVLRSAWLYSRHGNNFVNTMLRLLTEKTEVHVVNDQHGTPTHAMSLARAIWRLSAHADARGMWHWTDGGEATRYEFARAINELILPNACAEPRRRVVPISGEAYPTTAIRPAYAVLEIGRTSDLIGPPLAWQEELKTMPPLACRL